MNEEVSPLLGWKGNIELKRQMRKNPTPFERILWRELRNKKCKGIRFRRQHGIGPYITDFYHALSKTVIELDGKVHKDKDVKSQDRARERYLEDCGYRILRFRNEEVQNNLDEVLETILTVIGEPPSCQSRNPEYQIKAKYRAPSPCKGRAGEGSLTRSGHEFKLSARIESQKRIR